ncbi:MAG TPA: 2-dehydropantoate 2-reductase [Solirubrobacteraceae bacterium]
MKIAILGPGGVGGLLTAALERAGTPPTVIASETTTATIAEHGIRLQSVRFGELVAHPPVVTLLDEHVDALIVATKAVGLDVALQRVHGEPGLVLPLLNGLDHLAVLRRRFAPETVLAGAIRVESDRPEPGVVVHTSPFLRIDMAGDAGHAEAIAELAATFEHAEVPVRVLDSEPFVMWSKLVRLNALACTTSAFDMQLGAILSTPELRAELVGAIEEGCAVAQAEGAPISADDPLGELSAAHPSLGSSMQRDIAAGRMPELDAIPGSVLRAAARHRIACPTIERLTAAIAKRAGVPMPLMSV